MSGLQSHHRANRGCGRLGITQSLGMADYMHASGTILSHAYWSNILSKFPRGRKGRSGRVGLAHTSRRLFHNSKHDASRRSFP